MTKSTALPRARAVSKSLMTPARMFVSPIAAGRRITAGFSFIQRIGKAACTDVWFPDALRRELDQIIAEGGKLGPAHFPAQWAAVRQFELLQEAGNYKIYDLDATYLTRTLVDLARNMKGGGYRVIVVSLGSYDSDGGRDDLEILDKRLQDRISALTHMLYLEEQSETVNAELDKKLAEGRWDYRTELPHVGLTLGARDLFRPAGGSRQMREAVTIPSPPVVTMSAWVNDCGVSDGETGRALARVHTSPQKGQYAVDAGIYHFAAADCGRDVVISYMRNASGGGAKLSTADHKHKLSQHFFEILGLLPAQHIVHDTAVGLQLPDANSENEWIYLAQGEDTLRSFNALMGDLFTPFDGVSLSGLNGRKGATSEIKASVQHMRGYGDRLNSGADQFYSGLMSYTLQ
jgi:hypothetical protein